MDDTADMGGMAMLAAARKIKNERFRRWLRAVVFGGDQFGILNPVCRQFFQTTYPAGLAHPGHVLCLRGGSFTEMYGFPLTIYLLSGWLSERFPEINWMSHDAGHLSEMLFGWKANPHFGPFHLLSQVFILGGFWLLAKAWPVLYKAQQSGQLACTGPYGRIRHPQYAAFILVMVGFLVQWPTLITLTLFPILVVIYVRLAKREEKEALTVFGEDYRAYMDKTPGWWPISRRARTEP